MFKNRPLRLAAALALATALTSLSVQAFWGPFNMFRGWGGDPWYGGYPYYGYPWYGGYPYYGHPWYGGYPYQGGWGGYPYGYGWGAPYPVYPAVAAPVTRVPATSSDD